MSSLSVVPPDNTDSTQTMNLGKNDKDMVKIGEYQMIELIICLDKIF